MTERKRKKKHFRNPSYTSSLVHSKIKHNTNTCAWYHRMTCFVRLTSNSLWKTLTWDAERHTDLSPIYRCYTSLMHARYTMHTVLTRMHAHHTDTISMYPPEHLELVKATSSMAMSPYGPFPRTPSNTTCRGNKGKTTEITPATTTSFLPLKQAERNSNDRQTPPWRHRCISYFTKVETGNNKRRTS